ncbi:hypothetical protein ACH5RR_021256 [Cinchona calisaya]|uniref:Uncharacterized protein n=1 Tax=Cinchona calisaya TaxID=153742 RepID=A0ABD2ZGT4_9GENT
MSSMGDNTKSADLSISVESVDDQSSSIPPPKIATTASEPPYPRSPGCKKYPYSNPDKKQKTLEFKSQEGGAG